MKSFFLERPELKLNSTAYGGMSVFYQPPGNKASFGLEGIFANGEFGGYNFNSKVKNDITIGFEDFDDLRWYYFQLALIYKYNFYSSRKYKFNPYVLIGINYMIFYEYYSYNYNWEREQNINHGFGGSFGLGTDLPLGDNYCISLELLGDFINARGDSRLSQLLNLSGVSIRICFGIRG